MINHRITKKFSNLKQERMEHDIEHRDQLARLHDRHKRFSLKVYDHQTANEEEKKVKAHKKCKKASEELEAMKTKLLTKKGE